MQSLPFAGLSFADAPMPGGSGPVQLARLPELGDGVFRAFVRFAPGWTRPATGHYRSSEEVFVLEGDLTFNTIAWRAHSHGFVPADATRYRLQTSVGALVIAWFGGAPQWRRGPSERATREVMTSIAHWQQVPAHRLREAAGAAATWVEPAPRRLTAQRDLECVALSDRTWTHLRAGESLDLSAPTLCRIVGA